MKKIIISLAVLGLFGASIAYATPAIKAMKSYDYMAQIETTNQGNIFIYKVLDGKNVCYVMSNDFSVNARTNGTSLGISCVVNSVVK